VPKVSNREIPHLSIARTPPYRSAAPDLEQGRLKSCTSVLLPRLRHAQWRPSFTRSSMPPMGLCKAIPRASVSRSMTHPECRPCHGHDAKVAHCGSRLGGWLIGGNLNFVQRVHHVSIRSRDIFVTYCWRCSMGTRQRLSAKIPSAWDQLVGLEVLQMTRNSYR
jgi:hypothetical protein